MTGNLRNPIAYRLLNTAKAKDRPCLLFVVELWAHGVMSGSYLGPRQQVSQINIQYR
jgi:hypothetical protein